MCIIIVACPTDSASPKPPNGRGRRGGRNHCSRSPVRSKEGWAKTGAASRLHRRGGLSPGVARLAAHGGGRGKSQGARRRTAAGRRQPLKACLKTPRGPARRDFGGGQGGEAGASPERAVTAEPTPATGKRPVARRVFEERARWLRCSSVTGPLGTCFLVAPRHRALSSKTGPLGVLNQALRFPGRSWGRCAGVGVWADSPNDGGIVIPDSTPLGFSLY